MSRYRESRATGKYPEKRSRRDDHADISRKMNDEDEIKRKRKDYTANNTASRNHDEFDDRGDLIESQQLEYRAQIRIRERRALPADILIHQFQLLSGNEEYASGLKNEPCPLLRLPCDIISESIENMDAMQELIVVVCTLLRVYPVHKRMYWKYVALLLEACLQKEDETEMKEQEKMKDNNKELSNKKEEGECVSSSESVIPHPTAAQSDTLGGIENLHDNVRDKVRKLIESTAYLTPLQLPTMEAMETQHDVNLRRLYIACSYPDSAFLDGIRWDVAYVLANRWFEKFAAMHMNRYHEICEKYSLQESSLTSVRFQGLGNMGDDSAPKKDEAVVFGAEDERLRKGDKRSQELYKALTLLQRVGIHRLHEHETLLYTTPLKTTRNVRVLRGKEPPFVCRVQTGYEWNRYNSTHYDSSNLPPRVIKGYRIDVFYIDADAASTQHERFRPMYQLVPTDQGWDDKECFLIISGGVPFADLTFRVVNRPWNRNVRRGFRCTMNNGIFSLYVQLAYIRYRR